MNIQSMSDTASIGGTTPAVRDVTKPERTMTTLGLVVIGFFWTSGVLIYKIGT